MRSFKIKNKFHRLYLSFFMLIIGVGGSLLIGLSFASPPNPEGFADYCSLEANNTVIYGWAHDEDAPAGDAPSVNIRLSTGKSITVTSSRAGYRDAEINQDLSARGLRTSSVYGFRAVFTGVYKGSAPTISGTILNYGPGANTSLAINDFRLVNGNPNFPGKKIPDVCLGTVPTTPTPQPPTPQPPTPQPPTPTNPTTPRPPTTTATPRPPTTPRAPSPVPPLATPLIPISADANASVTPGTSIVSIVAPAGNAAILQIAYGTSDGTFNDASEDAPINAGSGNATVKLFNLQPKTQYFYQIRRFNADKTAGSSSATATFTTLGFDLSLAFTDKSTPLTNNEIRINQLLYQGNTDDKGEISIKDVPAGTYSLVFTYQDKEYKKEISVSTDSSELINNDESTATVYKAVIDVAELTPNSTEAPAEEKKKSSKLPLLIIPIILLALGGGAYWYIRRRSYKNDDSVDISYPPMTGQFSSPSSPQTNDYHVGESLKDMVLKSMQEEAQAKANKAKDKEV